MPEYDVFEGMAIGGPRHGAWLSASPTWQGVVRKGSVTAEAYPGRYEFDMVTGCWMWQAESDKA
jgi:hypothetical protein